MKYTYVQFLCSAIFSKQNWSDLMEIWILVVANRHNIHTNRNTAIILIVQHLTSTCPEVCWLFMQMSHDLFLRMTFKTEFTSIFPGVPPRSHVKVSQACSNVKRIVQFCLEESTNLHPFQLWFVDVAEFVLLTCAEIRESEIPYMFLLVLIKWGWDQCSLEDHGNAAFLGGCLYPKWRFLPSILYILTNIGLFMPFLLASRHSNKSH